MEDAWFEAIDKLKELKQVESVYFINEALKTYNPLQIKKYLYTDVNNS